MGQAKSYKKLDPELMRDIGQLVKNIVRAEDVSLMASAAEDCRKKTRRLLERVRDGTATDEERSLILWAVHRMSKEREPAKNSDHARQTYELTLKYLSPERPSAREIAQLVNVDFTTVQRDIASAIGRLAFWVCGEEALGWK